MFTRTAGIVAAGIQSCQDNLCRVPDLLQNSQKCRVSWYNSHRTHRSVGYCIQSRQGILCGYRICCRTHRSIGYCGATVTELTEVICGVTTDGNYPRYRSVGTLQNLSVVYSSFGNSVMVDSPRFPRFSGIAPKKALKIMTSPYTAVHT